MAQKLDCLCSWNTESDSQIDFGASVPESSPVCNFSLNGLTAEEYIGSFIEFDRLEITEK